MQLSEAFRLLGTSTVGDADSKYDRYLPRLRNEGSIALSEVDGNRIEAVKVREVAQWVSTLEDNDDLAYAMLSMSKRKLYTIGGKSTMLVTDARVVFVLDKFKNSEERIVGQVRYPWIDAIAWRPRVGRFKRPMVQLWMHEDFPVKHLGSWQHYIDVEFDNDVDTAAIALDLARRVSGHNLVSGSPAWIHDRLREQSIITQLPEPDETGEGLWECPASVPCPAGAEYVGDSPRPAEWIGRGAKAPASEPVAEPEPALPRTPSTIILKRMLARGKSIARERGHDAIGTDDLLLALLIDEDTTVGELMAGHGADYDTVKRHLDVASIDIGVTREPIRVGEQRLPLVLATQLVQAMQAVGQREDAGDKDGALVCARQVVALAEKSEISTLRAFAMVQLGDSCLARGRLSEARSAFTSAAALRSAPVLKKSMISPKIDPVETVDAALYGLWEVAGKRGDEKAEVAALEHLRKFRVNNADAEGSAWAAAQLARTLCNAREYSAATVWAETARAESTAAGQDEEAAHAAELLARACNKSGAPERALLAADEAIRGAVRVRNAEIEVAARLERALANKALGNQHAAWSEFLNLLPESRRNNKWRARQIVIQLAEFDVVSAAAHAIDTADEDVAFYGPRSAEITLAAARSLLADDAEQAHAMLLHSVRFVAGVLRHPETIDDNVDRVFTTLGEALAETDDDAFTRQAVATLVEQLRQLDPARLYRSKCADFLSALGDAKRYDVQAALARPVVDRLIETLSSESHPSGRNMVALVGRQWQLRRGLKFSGETQASLAVQEDILSWVRRVADISFTEEWRLAVALTSYGLDLMQAELYAEAHDKQTEAIALLRSAVARGEDHRELLVRVMQHHADLAAYTGDAGLQQARLQEALIVLDDAGDANWVGEAHARIEADLDDANGT